MKYILSIFLLLLVSCSSTQYTGVVTEKQYQPETLDNKLHYTYAVYNFTLKANDGSMHLIEVEKDEYLNTKVGDTITFKD